MKKLLTIFITLILTLFIAHQSFAISDDENEADAAAGEMAWVNFDGLDSDTQNMLYVGVERSGRSDEEHMAFLKNRLYRVTKDGKSVESIPALSHTAFNVSVNHPFAQAYSGSTEVTVFRREVVNPQSYVLGTSSVRRIDGREVSLVAGDHNAVALSAGDHNAVALSAGDHNAVALRAGDHNAVALSAGDHNAVALSAGDHNAVALRPIDQGTSPVPGTSPINEPTAEQIKSRTDISSNVTTSGANASGVKSQSASKVTISHFITNPRIKTGISNRKASEFSTSGGRSLSVSVVDSANSSLMQ